MECIPDFIVGGDVDVVGLTNFTILVCSNSNIPGHVRGTVTLGPTKAGRGCHRVWSTSSASGGSDGILPGGAGDARVDTVPADGAIDGCHRSCASPPKGE